VVDGDAFSDVARHDPAYRETPLCRPYTDDGTVARLRDIERFGATHGLKIYTVADLIQYRLRSTTPCIVQAVIHYLGYSHRRCHGTLH
jgi:hypothetical protein